MVVRTGYRQCTRVQGVPVKQWSRGRMLDYLVSKVDRSSLVFGGAPGRAPLFAKDPLNINGLAHRVTGTILFRRQSGLDCLHRLFVLKESDSRANAGSAEVCAQCAACAKV